MHAAARGLMALANCCALWQTNLLSVHHISILGTPTLLRRSACGMRWSSGGRASRPRPLGCEQQRQKQQQHGLRSSRCSGQRPLLASVPTALHPPHGSGMPAWDFTMSKFVAGAGRGKARQQRRRRRWGVVETETAGEG